MVVGGVQLDTLVPSSGRIPLSLHEHRRMETMLPKSARPPRLPSIMKSMQDFSSLGYLICKMDFMRAPS